MIEARRYVRLKSSGLAWAVPTEENGGGLYIYFKRFDVETGRELEPEKSFLSFKELSTRLEEMETEIQVIREFLALERKT